MHFYFTFSELKIGVHLKFKALFLILQKSQKHHFPKKTIGLAKRVVHFMDSKMCAYKNLFLQIPF
jgi:hypothetical protein